MVSNGANLHVKNAYNYLSNLLETINFPTYSVRTQKPNCLELYVFLISGIASIIRVYCCGHYKHTHFKFLVVKDLIKLNLQGMFCLHASSALLKGPLINKHFLSFFSDV